MDQVLDRPAPDGADEEEEHVTTAGSYVLNALYIVLFFIGYLWVFFELSHRWPVG